MGTLHVRLTCVLPFIVGLTQLFALILCHLQAPHIGIKKMTYLACVRRMPKFVTNAVLMNCGILAHLNQHSICTDKTCSLSTTCSCKCFSVPIRHFHPETALESHDHVESVPCSNKFSKQMHRIVTYRNRKGETEHQQDWQLEKRQSTHCPQGPRSLKRELGKD